MSYRLGFSSCSAPELSADDLLELSLANDADTIDLRAGRGQAWESVAGLRAIADALDVAFLALPAALGGGADDGAGAEELVRAAVERGIPLRFGVVPEVESSRFGEDVRRLRSRWGSDLVLYVEPHGPSPSLASLSELLREHEVYAAADNLGFARLGAPPAAVAGFMAEFGRVLQVKGFAANGDGGGWRHRPLVTTPAVLDDVVGLVSTLPPRELRVTIETRCGSHADDLAALREALRDGSA